MAVTRPALLLAPPNFLEEIGDRLHEAGITEAVGRHDSGPIFEWLVSLFALQGISDRAAFAYADRHGGVTWREIEAALRASPACGRLKSYWHFDGCGYRKAANTCAEPQHIRRCPLPRHDLRKGGLNTNVYSLALFFRDVCGGDFVGWTDARLAAADPGRGVASRAEAMRSALLEPLINIVGTGAKLWSMTLAELLLVGDPARERWVTTGASMIAVDTLVHAFWVRTGILKRFAAAHPYGPRCYAPGGCADIIARLSDRIDAREFNPSFPRDFPRFIQHAIWLFCAEGGRDICNGRKIDDARRCAQIYCPAYPICDRVCLHSSD